MRAYSNMTNQLLDSVYKGLLAYDNNFKEETREARRLEQVVKKAEKAFSEADYEKDRKGYEAAQDAMIKAKNDYANKLKSISGRWGGGSYKGDAAAATKEATDWNDIGSDYYGTSRPQVADSLKRGFAGLLKQRLNVGILNNRLNQEEEED